jgi:hypothetical protein
MLAAKPSQDSASEHGAIGFDAHLLLWWGTAWKIDESSKFAIWVVVN